VCVDLGSFLQLRVDGLENVWLCVCVCLSVIICVCVLTCDCVCGYVSVCVSVLLSACVSTLQSSPQLGLTRVWPCVCVYVSVIVCVCVDSAIFSAGLTRVWLCVHVSVSLYARRTGQPTQRATNYTARSNIVTAQIFLYANGQRPKRAMIRQRSRRRQARGATHRARPRSPSRPDLG